MIIQPRTRGFICLTSHPEGTAQNIKNQIEYVKSKGEIANGPKKVLVIGASTGFGIASRISAAFGSGAATIGVFLKNQQQRVNLVQLVGTIPLLLKNKHKKLVFMQKVSMVMLFLMKSKNKRSN